MPLTDSVCKHAKPKEKPYRLFDSGGLYLQVMPRGSKYWRFKYRYLQKEKTYALGTYPLTTLAEAREERDKAKKLVKQNIDPNGEKRQGKLSVFENRNKTFRAVAIEWLELRKSEWSQDYYDKVKRQLELNLYPHLGNDQITTIDSPQLLDVLKKVEGRGSFEQANRCRNTCSQIFRYGIQMRKCTTDPAAHLIGALKRKARQHYAALETDEIPDFLLALLENKASLYPRTLRAIKLSLLTFVRPGELRTVKKTQIDLDKAQIVKDAEDMKTQRSHIVPLSSQAIEIINDQLLETGHLKTPYLFPNQKDYNEPMSDGTVNVALGRLGFSDRMTAHGFRALARTAIREELNYDADIIEMQLAHKPTGPLGAAYDRAKFIKQRKKMMQDWADYIDVTRLKALKKSMLKVTGVVKDSSI